MQRWIVILLLVCGAGFGAIWFYPQERGQIMEIGGPKMYLDKMFSDIVKTTGVIYSTAPGYKTKILTQLVLDVYAPSGDIRQSRPAIVLYPGGGFSAGDRGIYGDAGFGWGRYFAERGYVVFAVNYRLGERFLKLDDPELEKLVEMATSDALSSVRWVRLNAEKYRVDPGRIVVGGQSAGAVLALYTAYHVGESGDNVDNLGPSDRVSAVVSLAGTLSKKHLGQIGESSPPAIMFAGQDDDTVPYSWSLAVKDKLKEVGVRVDWYSYKGVAHEVAGYKQVAPKVADFLYEIMQLDQPSVTPSPILVLAPSPTWAPSPTVIPVVVTQVASPSYTPLPTPPIPSKLPVKLLSPKPTVKPSPLASPVVEVERELVRMTPADFVWQSGKIVEPIVESNYLQEIPQLNTWQFFWQRLKGLLSKLDNE